MPLKQGHIITKARPQTRGTTRLQIALICFAVPLAMAGCTSTGRKLPTFFDPGRFESNVRMLLEDSTVPQAVAKLSSLGLSCEEMEVNASESFGDDPKMVKIVHCSRSEQVSPLVTRIYIVKIYPNGEKIDRLEVEMPGIGP